MKGPYWGWYLLIGIVVLAPAGVRMWTWARPRPQTLEPQMVQAGQTLFLHEWTANDPMASGGGDGLGPVFNASSCAFCHNQGGVGGGGDLAFNVTTYVYRSEAVASAHHQPREGVVHASAVNNVLRETLNQLHPSLPPVNQPTLSMLVSLSGNQSNHCITVPADVRLSQRNTPALFGANLIDAIPDRVLIANEKKERLYRGLASEKSEDLPIGRAPRLADGRVGHFGWKAQSPSLSSFVQAACANELGLSNPGQAQPRPLGYPEYRATGFDLTLEQCDQITSFVASLSRPVEKLPDDSFLRGEATEGKQLFHKVGCAECHMPNVGNVEGLYSDLLLHDMGTPLEGGGSYNDVPLPPNPNSPPPSDGPSPGEWRTPPLWGVADSAPYLHDGRASTLEEAIRQHGGQGKRAARDFSILKQTEQAKVIAFLRTLRAP
ncbi:MAG: di-heme oxidoredictase family protein [Gemmataceae bacterium]